MPQPPNETPRQFHFIEGGSVDVQVSFPPETLTKINNALHSRCENSKRKVSNDARLSIVDRFALHFADEVAQRIKTAKITKEDIALVWYVIHDEMLQISLESGYVANETPQRRRRFIFRTIAEKPQTEIEMASFRSTPGKDFDNLFRLWGPEQLKTQLLKRNELRLDIESGFFEKGFEDPLFERISTSVHPLRIGQTAGNRLHHAILHHLTNVSRQRYGDKSLIELWNDDPAIALRALLEANELALTTFVPESARQLLLREKPNIRQIIQPAVEQKADPEGQIKQLPEFKRSPQKQETSPPVPTKPTGTGTAAMEAQKLVLKKKEEAVAKMKDPTPTAQPLPQSQPYLKRLIQEAPFPDDIKTQLVAKVDTFSPAKKEETETACWGLIATDYQNKLSFETQNAMLETATKGTPFTFDAQKYRLKYLIELSDRLGLSFAQVDSKMAEAKPFF